MSDAPGSARLTATPAGVTLGPVNIVVDGAARGFVLQIGDQYFHGFVVRQGADVIGYVDRCPHMGVPLARELDAYMAPMAGMLACGWHGALFRVRDGRCIAGPCTGTRLMPWPVTIADGMIRTA